MEARDLEGLGLALIVVGVRKMAVAGATRTVSGA